MKEEYLHYAFKSKVFGDTFTASNSEIIKVKEFGEHNQNAGPDFIDSQIIYDGKLWVGAIEFHVNASDWYRHGHQNDPAYGTVIAHFVYENDSEVKVNGFVLPVVELKGKIDQERYLQYTNLVKSKFSLPCNSHLSDVPNHLVQVQKEVSLKERLWKKALVIVQDIEGNQGDRMKAFLLALARSVGGNVNGLPFESLVEGLNISWLAKLNYDPFRVEALILGLSGLLSKDSEDSYVLGLIGEYEFQKHLFGIPGDLNYGFKYSRMRPNSFPDIRLAQLAALLNKRVAIKNVLDPLLSLDELKTEFNIELNSFWSSHYRLKNKVNQKVRREFSTNMVELIIINAVVPFVYAIGLLDGNDSLTEKALNMLRKLKPEKNTIISNWKKAGVEVNSAFDSQSLLELKKHGCNRKKCLFCAIGKQILKR